MNVADCNAQSNPISTRPTAEQLGETIGKLAGDRRTDVTAAAKAGDFFDTVERAVFSRVLEIGRQAMNLLLSLQGEGDLGDDQNAPGQRSRVSRAALGQILQRRGQLQARRADCRRQAEH